MRAFAAIFTVFVLSGCGVLVAPDGTPAGNERSNDLGAPSDTRAPSRSGAVGSGVTSPSSSIGPTCPGDLGCQRLVFVTGDTWAPTEIPSIAEADARCEQAASESRLPVFAGRHFRAWFGDATHGPRDWTDHGTAPYVLVDGTRVASSFAAFVSAADLDHAIDRDEDGDPQKGLVWTGTRADGSGVPIRCVAVASDSGPNNKGKSPSLPDIGSGIRGVISDGATIWTDASAGGDPYGCDVTEEARLYCFER